MTKKVTNKMTNTMRRNIVLMMALLLLLSIPLHAMANQHLTYGQIEDGNESNTLFAGIQPLYKYNSDDEGFGNEEGKYTEHFKVVDTNGGDAIKLTYLTEVADENGNVYIIDTVYVKAGNFYTPVTINPELNVGDSITFNKEDHGIKNPNGSASLQISHIGIYPGATRTPVTEEVRRSFYLAAHAATVKMVDGMEVQSETLWAADGAVGTNRFAERGSWATYIHFADQGLGVLEGQKMTYNLYAGQHIPVGTLSVWFDRQHIYVTYTTMDGWLLSESHLDVAALFTGLRGTKGLGRYPYTQQHNPLTNEYTYMIPLPSEGFGI